MTMITYYHGDLIELNKPSDLPNSEGFHFSGCDRKNKTYRCEVIKDPVTGLHSVEGMEFSEMVGWFC